MRHTFLYISLPSLHDYDVKIPNFTFNGGRNQATTNFSFSQLISKFECSPQEINSKEIRRLHLTFPANWNIGDKV